MKKIIFTLILAVFAVFGFNANAQTTYNVSPSEALNEYMAENYDSTGLSTYVLERDGYYILTGSMNFSGDLAIVAAEGDGARPVVIMGTNDEGASNGWGMLWTDGSIHYKSINWKVTNNLGARGPWSSALFSTSGSNITIEMVDCIVEYSDGVSVWNESGTGVTLILRDNLFRWNGTNDGGPWQGFASLLKNGDLDLAIMENNTFVENYSCLFIHENGHVKNWFCNHNTIISNGQGPWRYTFVDRAVFMNNLHVDAHFGGETPSSIEGQDAGGQPMGVYCLNYYRSDTIIPPEYPEESDRINVVAYNSHYLTSGLKNYIKNAPDTFIYASMDNKDGFFNDRTMDMLTSSNGMDYPLFKYDDELSVFIEEPGFNDYSVKTDEEILISQHMNGDTTVVLSTENGQWGRYPEAEGNASYPLAKDYYDFSYTNEKLQNAGHAGYPIGDLNWFPEKKAEWENDPDRENYDDIIASVLDGSFEFVDWNAKSGIFSREKTIGYYAFPNPVTHGTLYVKGKENKLKTVYNLTGQVLVQTRENQIDVSDLKSGMYLLEIENSIQKVVVK
jgi:hypothetical protein